MNFFRGNKYKNKKTSHAGLSFASKGEAALYDQLVLEQQMGLICDIKLQQSVYLTDARIQYIADFSAVLVASQQKFWAEYKGFETDVWRIKRRLWKHYGPGLLKVYKGRGKSIVLTEEITPHHTVTNKDVWIS